jgi:hypothetical protein
VESSGSGAGKTPASQPIERDAERVGQFHHDVNTPTNRSRFAEIVSVEPGLFSEFFETPAAAPRGLGAAVDKSSVIPLRFAYVVNHFALIASL